MPNIIDSKYPAGHFYSPIVNPNEVRDYVRDLRTVRPDGIAGIGLNLEKMKGFWAEFVKTSDLRIPAFDKRHEQLYYSNNASFGLGDAIVLGAMLIRNKPRRVIEVGSGFSTLRILDVLHEARMVNTDLVVIDPFPDRLKRLLPPDLLKKVRLIESPVQAVGINEFTDLDENDILFIDSTHVLKTGSDVHYELIKVLPSLKAGVSIHFHDIQYPFEYPDHWIQVDNLSWNEAYAVQLFLMYNSHFYVDFFNNLFGRFCYDTVLDSFPEFGRPSDAFGGSLWLRKV